MVPARERSEDRASDRPFGMVHLRAQPFHNDHLEYVLTALSLTEHLIVGITNPDPSTFREEPSSPHRHLAGANPYTYFQRARMIELSLDREGVALSRVTVVPFDPTDPAKWSYYLPVASAVTQYVRLFSSWEDRKADLLRAYGFDVYVVDRRAEKQVTATQVRELLQSGGDWRRLVPDGTAAVLEMIALGIL
jgi:nicotinamide-nucleotide adenylyltransferase